MSRGSAPLLGPTMPRFSSSSMIRAARVFSARAIGDTAGVQYTALDEQQALIELLRVENIQEAPNMITGRRRFPTFQPAEGLTDRLLGGVFL